MAGERRGGWGGCLCLSGCWGVAGWWPAGCLLVACCLSAGLQWRSCSGPTWLARRACLIAWLADRLSGLPICSYTLALRCTAPHHNTHLLTRHCPPSPPSQARAAARLTSRRCTTSSRTTWPSCRALRRSRWSSWRHHQQQRRVRSRQVTHPRCLRHLLRQQRQQRRSSRQRKVQKQRSQLQLGSSRKRGRVGRTLGMAMVLVRLAGMVMMRTGTSTTSTARSAVQLYS